MFISKSFAGILFVAAAHAAAIGRSAERPRSSDAGGLSLRQPDASIDDATVDADFFWPIWTPSIVKDTTGLVKDITGAVTDIGGRSLTGADDADAIVAAAVADIVNLYQGPKRSSTAGDLSVRQLDDAVDGIDTPIDDAAVEAEMNIGGALKKGLKFLGKAGKAILKAGPEIVKTVDVIVGPSTDGAGGSDLAIPSPEDLSTPAA